jgi:hypothetical protein
MAKTAGGGIFYKSKQPKPKTHPSFPTSPLPPFTWGGFPKQSPFPLVYPYGRIAKNKADLKKLNTPKS